MLVFFLRINHLNEKQLLGKFWEKGNIHLKEPILEMAYVEVFLGKRLNSSDTVNLCIGNCRHKIELTT